MKIKLDLIYKSMLFSLLFLPILVGSPELNVLLSLSFFFLIILFQNNLKFSKTGVVIIAPLIFVLIISIISSFFYSNTIIDLVKDLLILMKPIIYILLGFYLVGKIKDKSFIYVGIIYIAAFFGIIHIYKVSIFLIENPFVVNLIRNSCGKDNFIELFALILLFSQINQVVFLKKINHYKFLKVIILVSFFLYFSRTMLITGLIFLLATKGYTKLTRKGVMFLSVFIVLVLGFFSYLNSIDIERESEGIEGFLYKIKLAPSEIFPSKIDVTNHADLWDHWRGYEALKAYEQLEETPNNIGFLFGKGIGSLVDLEFIAPLNDEGMQYISTLHNGYAFILFKAGFIGLICYFFFLLFIYLQAYNKSENNKIFLLNNFISGIGIYYAFTTLVISGIYNKGDILAIILGGFLYLKMNIKYQIDENRNFRD